MTIGGAAGIAAAFRSPIGGICYMMEDMSSYWNHETTVRAFGGTLVATMVFSFLLNSMHGVNYDPLVIFDDDAEKTDWKIKDLPYFLILAVIVGVVSSFYSELLFLSQRLRRHRKNFKTPFWKTVEVFFVSLLFCSIPLYYPNLFDCHKLPTAALNCDPNDGCDGAHGVCTACCKDYLVSHSDSCAACVAEECMVDTGRRATGEAWAEKVRSDCPFRPAQERYSYTRTVSLSLCSQCFPFVHTYVWCVAHTVSVRSCTSSTCPPLSPRPAACLAALPLSCSSTATKPSTTRWHRSG